MLCTGNGGQQRLRFGKIGQAEVTVDKEKLPENSKSPSFKNDFAQIYSIKFN